MPAWENRWRNVAKAPEDHFTVYTTPITSRFMLAKAEVDDLGRFYNPRGDYRKSCKEFTEWEVELYMYRKGRPVTS